MTVALHDDLDSLVAKIKSKEDKNMEQDKRNILNGILTKFIIVAIEVSTDETNLMHKKKYFAAKANLEISKVVQVSTR